MNSQRKNKIIIFGWCAIVGGIVSIMAMVTGHFVAGGFTFTFAFWGLYKMQNYKHDRPDRPVLCSIVGHQAPVYADKGWWSPGEEYGRVIVGPTDGTMRVHAKVEAKCARCQEKFIVARIHLPREEK